MRRLKQEIDRPIAQLILDLEARGLLNRTLVMPKFVCFCDRFW